MGGDICAPCCGAEREVSVACPLECPYLQEAHRHEKSVSVDPKQWPNQDVMLSEHFVNEHQTLVNYTGACLASAALQMPGAVDADLREALESLIRTYRTRASGLYYETRPANLLAAAIHQRLGQNLEEYRQRQRERTGLSAVRDADLLGALVFWQRTALANNSGRRLGRSFLAALRDSLLRAGFTLGPEGPVPPSRSPLVVP